LAVVAGVLELPIFVVGALQEAVVGGGLVAAITRVDQFEAFVVFTFLIAEGAAVVVAVSTAIVGIVVLTAVDAVRRAALITVLTGVAVTPQDLARVGVGENIPHGAILLHLDRHGLSCQPEDFHSHGRFSFLKTQKGPRAPRATRPITSTLRDMLTPAQS